MSETTIERAPVIPGEVVELLDRLDVRYELIEGQLVVSPSATFGHERLSSIVRAQLVYQAPEGLEVLGPDFNVLYAWPEPFFICPDALVARTRDVDDDAMRVAPLLVLEMLSRSSRRRDRGDKADLYAALGVPSYWLIDPAARRLALLELRQGAYVEVAAATGDEELVVELPFPARISLRRPRLPRSGAAG